MGAPSEDLVAWARDLARGYLDVPQFRDARWRHVQAVGAKAAALAPAFGIDGDILVAAAWLHDIGYSPELARTGFHPLDGARLIARAGQRRIAALVAHHSGAGLEARLRGLGDDMAEFRDEQSPVRDALWACDMTTSPTGQPVTFGARLAEIENRYGRDHSVARAISAASADIRRAIAATGARASNVGSDLGMR
ncbi:HD domain-containing protein [Krasilnikovia cinnamomea]|nr:HD domain-containing protein [Krasilnikovia cinnamomea]